MEISLYIDWGSFLVGVGSGMLLSFVVALVIGYKYGRKEQQVQAGSSEKKKK